jgi:hypothetical protein
MKKLRVKPITISEANRWVEHYHRHNRRVSGGMFALSAVNGEGKTVGVAIVGRPIARLNDDRKTAEVLRVVTDGTKNANSFLYGACWRAVQALGYRRIITYTLKSESGSSLRAVGWERKEVKSGSWNRQKRRRQTQPVSLQDKYRWTKEAP